VIRAIDTIEAEAPLPAAGALLCGTVFRKYPGQYFVRSEQQTIVCSSSNRLRKQLLYPTSDPSSGTLRRVQKVKEIEMVDPVAIGDRVQFLDAGDGTGVIREVLPRSTKLARYAAGTKPLEHVIVANLDQVLIIVAAAQPAPTWGLVDRYLVSTESCGLPARICLTKIDLADEAELLEAIRIYEAIGYPVSRTSASTGQGIDAFRELTRDQTSCLVGKSGVGKTSLLNALQPGLGLKVKEISGATGKGRHTTTHLEMFPLEGGGGIVDTPGIKQFGLWEVESQDLASLFVEMRPYVHHCRFRPDCAHTHEPGCAVRAAVKAGAVSRLRYESYLRMRG
jgi:ribosome biogenesis GTPase